MKNIKRRYVYSILAVPFVVFGVYATTLSPLERGAFFSEFMHKTVVLFTGESEEVPDGISTGGEPGGAPGGEAPEGRPGGARAGGGGGFDPEAFFARRDGDGDGKLTGEEISQRMRQNLEEIDADQDGSVTLEEFQAGMRQMFARRGAGRPGQESEGGSGVEGSGESEADVEPRAATEVPDSAETNGT